MRTVTESASEETMNTFSAPLSQALLREFPQVREKAVVDAVNGLEVLDDHLRVRDTGSVFLKRVWGSITGSTARRQQALDRGVHVALTGAVEWLQALEAAQARSDIAMATVVERLSETRAGVMRLQERHRRLAGEVAALLDRLDAVVEQTAALRQALAQERLERRAWDEVQFLQGRCTSGALDHLPPVARVVQVVDEAHWGAFGASLRQGLPEAERQRLLQHLIQTLQAYLRGVLGDAEQQPLYHVDGWLTGIPDLTADRKEVMMFLWQDANSDLKPLTHAVVGRLQQPAAALSLHLPRMLPARRMVDVAVGELARLNPVAAA